MKKYIISPLLLINLLAGFAQVPQEPVANTTEQQLENMTANSEDLETEDDSYLQQMRQLEKHPVNLNNADEELLMELGFLSPTQIRNLLAYRSLLGKLINIYELQAIPGWDVTTIQKVRPFVTVSEEKNILAGLATRLRNGENSLLIRVSQTLEKSKGYRLDTASAKSYYPGSPQRIFVRYKFTHRNFLQYGILGEKDAGEEFFRGSQKKGFDFYSAHFFARNAGIIKSLALGDFTVNLGQGLTQWMSLAFKKGPDITTIKRQSAILRPYNSTGEVFFHRGAGLTIGRGKWQATIFGSLRKVDANFKTDSAASPENFITALQTSGLHRTNSELEDKGIQRQFAFGGNISWQQKRLHLGVNGIQFRFKYPLMKAPEPYNLYALAGERLTNYSTDYSYTFKNIHVFGEAAISNKRYGALVQGLLLSLATNVDMSFVYRCVSKGYQSLYSNAFTETASPTNEKGFFAGVTVHPHSSWRIAAYADVYRFPWLKFRLNNPSYGKEYMIQFEYKLTKRFEIYSRYKAESKSVNDVPLLQTLTPVLIQVKKSWRTNFIYKVNPVLTSRTRLEILWFDKNGPAAEEGFLMYFDLLYKPLLKRLSGNLRLQYFETGGYNSRLYAYENDVLYSYTIPAFYSKGCRYYFNLHYSAGRNVGLWARWARFIYADKEFIGSGPDEIKASHKSEWKLQILYKF
jgi:hypothetical protein